MKYKICRKTHKTLKLKDCSNGSRKTELTEKVLFFAKRKGRIFGFWHDVGTELCDYEGGTFISIEYFESPDDCEDYVRKYHKYHYCDKHKLEIFKELDIK